MKTTILSLASSGTSVVGEFDNDKTVVENLASFMAENVRGETHPDEVVHKYRLKEERTFDWKTGGWTNSAFCERWGLAAIARV